MERIEYYPEMSAEEIKQEQYDTYDWTIQDFKGFMDKRTGKSIPCTRENKIKLMKVPVFDRFIARCQQLLSESGIQKEKAEIKKEKEETKN